MSVKGTPAFDTLAVSRINIDFMPSQATIEVTAAFANSQTGQTHGWTKGNGLAWSKETLMAIRTLRERMAEDLAKLHFKEFSVAEPGGGAKPSGSSGIAEHLGSAPTPDAESV